MTKLLQLNARRSPPVWKLLEAAANEHEVDIVAVQDPPMEAKLPIGKWEGYTFLFGRGARPLVAIAAKKFIEFSGIGAGVCKGVWVGSSRFWF